MMSEIEPIETRVMCDDGLHQARAMLWHSAVHGSYILHVHSGEILRNPKRTNYTNLTLQGAIKVMNRYARKYGKPVVVQEMEEA